MTRKSWIVGGLAAAAGVVAGAYGAARLAGTRARTGSDPYRDHSFTPPYDRQHLVETDDGTRLHVIERGLGIPVVMGHGVTIDRRTWTHQLEGLPDRGVRAVVFDQRGHGRSTVGTEGFGLEQLADDLRAVVVGLDLRGAVLVGHSMGGIGVLSFISRHPDVMAERVAGLVLMSTTAYAQGAWKWLDRFVTDGAIAKGDALFARLLARRDAGYLMTRVGLGRRPFPSHVEVNRRMILDTPATTRARAMRPLVAFDVRSSLPGVGVPTLVVCGTADRLTPPRLSKSLARDIPGAHLVLIRGAGHMPMLEQADRINELLSDFAHEVSPRPTRDGGATGRGDRGSTGMVVG